MRKLWVLLALTVLISSCSSLQRSAPENSAPNSATPSQDSSPPRASQSKSASPGLLSSQDVSRGRKLSERYQRFVSALRAMDEKVIMEEAGKFLSVDENDPVILNGLALFKLQGGKPEAARIFWERALSAHKDHPTFLNNLAVLDLRKGEDAVALEYLRTAYRKDPRHFEVLLNLGTVYLKGGQFQKAKDFFEQASRMRNSIAVKKDLAVSYHLAGDFRKAKTLYEEVLKEDMRNVPLMLNYASLLVEHLKDMAEAKVWLNRINFLGSDDQAVMRRAQQLHEKTL